MPTRARSILWLTLATSFTACSEGPSRPPPDDTTPDPRDKTRPDPRDYTVSYRSLVRVPQHGIAMKQQAFADQVARLDPIEVKRCPVINHQAFQTAADALGGITWTHPIAMLKDQSIPPLHRGRIPPPQPPAPSAPGAGDSAGGPAPTIVRPDLVGYQDDTAIFLSQQHGLLTVKTGGPAPVLSCALKLPGQPKYFFYQGNELVLLVNGLSVNQAALLRFRVRPQGFDFLDTVMLDQQSIQDARLFDRTLIVYTNLLRPIVPTAQTPGGGAAGGGAVGPGARPGPGPGPVYSANMGVAVTAIAWNAALTVAWHEEFLNDPATADPLAGQDPVMATSKLAIGDVVSTAKTFKPFISASDRYVVVSRDVNRTIFSGTRTQSYSYCAASRQGPARSVQTCSPKYEQRPNPDYRPPQTAAGDYDCNGKALLQCIQEAAPTVSQYIHVRVGETCTTHTYHEYICDRQETRVVSYPMYSQQQVTQFVVYRYGDGDFVKLDERIYEMADPGAGAANVASLTFNGKPLEVDGSIDHKGDLQFQRGHFYVLTHQGQQLHTLLIVGNSIAKLGKQATPRQSTGTYSYSGGHSTMFSADRMMISRAYYDPRRPMNIPNWSDVIMLDVSVPAFPRRVNQFVMPGSSDQLILAADGVLGPGTVAFTHAGVPRNLQKLTLFSRTDASELGNLLLGTEFNANMVSTWLGTPDDQRIRLDYGNQRLFLPYAGYHHAPTVGINPVAHRLNITAIAGGQLTSEATFEFVEDIVRTVSTSSAPDAGRALAFGESSVYALNQTPGSWSLDVIEEFATPVAVYRFSDKGDLHARIDQIGTRCQISTFSGSLNAFKAAHVAVGPQILCPDGTAPAGIGASLVYAQTGTGWRLSPDGRTITALDATAVKERLTHVNKAGYCAIDATVYDGTPVPHLDEIPPSIVCFPTYP